MLQNNLLGCGCKKYYLSENFAQELNEWSLYICNYDNNPQLFKIMRNSLGRICPQLEVFAKSRYLNPEQFRTMDDTHVMSKVNKIDF